MANSHRVFEGSCCSQYSSNYLSVDRQLRPRGLASGRRMCVDSMWRVRRVCCKI